MGAENITLKARLILQQNNKILLLKQTKPNGGNYSLVGGTIEEKEFAKATLIRESKEEAGLILKPQHLKLVHVLHKRRGSTHRMTLYFWAENWFGEVKSREKHKFLKVEWFPLNELPDNLTGTVKHILDEFRKGNAYSEFSKK
ncbi:MAG: NUDIX domain-containing protein [Saprospiraceae bacterium]